MTEEERFRIELGRIVEYEVASAGTTVHDVDVILGYLLEEVAKYEIKTLKDIPTTGVTLTDVVTSNESAPNIAANPALAIISSCTV